MSIDLENPQKKGYIELYMRVLMVFFLLITGFGGLWAQSPPEWLLPLREAYYEQKLKANEVKPLYEDAKTAAAEHYTGADLDLALSRCEYFMGRVLQDEKRDNEARPHYLEGMRLAEKALAEDKSAAAWVALAQNLSQNCSLGPWTYTVANGLDVEKYAKNALALDSRNASAQFLIAARWVYAPALFSNHKKGIQMMEAIIAGCDMEKANYFDVYTAIGYAYVQQKKYDEAKPWLLKSLEIYPTNKYAAELLATKK